MSRNDKKKFSKMMLKQEKEAEKKAAKKAEEEKEKQKEKQALEEAKNADANVELAKTTKLAFFKEYYTYQAFLEVHPGEGISAEGCYHKTILYIMRWFRNRLGEDIYERYPETVYLKEDFPAPENYKDFNISESRNINGFSFIDFEAAYINDKCNWLARLTEPDNGNENSGVNGRTFTTEIFVNKLENSVALGIRESCREPESNAEDASGLRPGFVRDMFYDDEIILSEFGLDKKYAFLKAPIKINGKSGEACEKLYDELISSDNRQMPILFVPGNFYSSNTAEVDKKTRSLLGFAHVVVWENSSAKLFNQVMKSEELAEVANEGQLIFYRSTNKQDYPSDYYELDTENMLEEIKERAHKEPCRKNIDFKDNIFKPNWWEYDKNRSPESISLNEEESSAAYEMEISQLKNQMDNLRNDNEKLQQKLSQLESENSQFEKDYTKAASDNIKYEIAINDFEHSFEELKKENRILKEQKQKSDNDLKGLASSEKERYKPLFDLPKITKDNKEDLIKWIEKYYSDVIVIHKNARKTLKDEDRALDWDKVCMMIHYLAGYTKYRNDGGVALNANAARNYDPTESGYTVEPVQSGQGSANMHKDKYTIDVNGKDVVMDLHIKTGKGSDSQMIRIYFYYDPSSKKSVIGAFPQHLPTRASAH